MISELRSAISALRRAEAVAGERPKEAKKEIQSAVDLLLPLVAKGSQGPDDGSGDRKK